MLSKVFSAQSLGLSPHIIDVEVDVSAEELAQVLTMAGMEVEHLQKHGNDWVFDIEITTNRYDWLSMRGIAGEIAACLGKKLKGSPPKVSKSPRLTGRSEQARIAACQADINVNIATALNKVGDTANNAAKGAQNLSSDSEQLTQIAQHFPY